MSQPVRKIAFCVASWHALVRSLAAVGMATLLLLGTAEAQVTARDSKSAKLYEDALARFERNDAAGAIIQLKNALQQEPRMLSAQLLLGRAQLAIGDAAGAEEAFNHALDLGVDRAEVALPLAQALYDQGKFQVLLERIPADVVSGPQRAQLLVVRGHAYRGQADLASAATAFQAARAADPRYVPAMLSLAELLERQGKHGESAKLADEATTIAPQDARAWFVKGSIAQAGGDGAAALSAYDKALAIDARALDARIARASLLMALDKNDAAKADIDYLKRERPDDPRANYVRAVYLASRDDPKGAQQALQEVAEFVDSTRRDIVRTRLPELLLLGGLAHHGLNQSEKARSYLDDYLKLDPRQPIARKALGSILLARGDYRGAVSALEIAQKEAPWDAQTLAMLAAAHMGLKQYTAATAYLERALKVSGGAAGLQTSLGLNLVGAGEQALGIEQLQRALEKDPGQLRAGVALTILYLRRGDAAKAVKTADAISRRNPQNVALQNLLAVARAAAEDRAGARAAYEQALKLDPGFVPSQLNLARLDLVEGKAAAARERLTAALKARPRDPQIMFELAVAEETTGRTAEAITLLEKAHAIDRRNLAVSKRLVDIYLQSRSPEKALDIAKEAEGVAPENFGVLASLGTAYLAVGNQKAAQGVFNRMSRLATLQASALTEVARYQLAASDEKSALYSLNKALADRPDYVPAQALLAEIDLVNGDTVAAEQRAKIIVSKSPASGEGYRLLGDIAFTRKKFADSADAYRSALAKEARLDTALRLYRAYLEGGRRDKAQEVMESWIKTRPSDSAAMLALAEGNVRAGDLAAARSWYERALKIRDEDASLLNNYAMVLARLNDPAAIQYAERAQRLAPTDGAVQDTLGWILVQKGDLEVGLRNLREARLRSPRNPEIRYHLAVALARAGRKEEARAELQEALGPGLAFEGQEEARSLLRELSSR